MTRGRTELASDLSLPELACLLVALFGPAALLWWAREVCRAIAWTGQAAMAWSVAG